MAAKASRLASGSLTALTSRPPSPQMTTTRYFIMGHESCAYDPNSFAKFEDAWNYGKNLVLKPKYGTMDGWKIIHTKALDCFADFEQSEMDVWYFKFAVHQFPGDSIWNRKYLKIVRQIWDKQSEITEVEAEQDFQMYEKHWNKLQDEKERLQDQNMARYDSESSNDDASVIELDDDGVIVIDD
jgi:hypothetical protein